MGFLVAGTWSFSGKGVEKAAKLLAAGGSALDAAEAAVREAEDDPAVLTVGSGGFPNLHGEQELDAAIMNGDTLELGAVMGLRGFPHPVSVARRLMEATPHTVLVGAGADAFALEQGFSREPRFSREALEQWLETRESYRAEGRRFPPLDSCLDGKRGVSANLGLQREPDGGGSSHDTVGIVVLDSRGSMAAATSTSGLMLKLPGRVGDSPLVGSGFYADSSAGAAVATGVGEDIMRGCASYLAVSLLAAGMDASQAAYTALSTLHRRLAAVRGGDGRVGKMALICAGKNGEWGAAANHGGFGFACNRNGEGVRGTASNIRE